MWLRTRIFTLFHRGSNAWFSAYFRVSKFKRGELSVETQYATGGLPVVRHGPVRFRRR
jgi:hypothetical protein